MRFLVLKLLLLLFPLLLLSSCAAGSHVLHDGYYSAETIGFDLHGWKEYVIIYVSNGKIITVEYNAYNASGFIKSWDADYMRSMSAKCGTYPNEYTREYMISLLNWQDPSKVDAVSGATSSHAVFQRLSQAAIDQSRMGNKQVALIDLPSSDA